jgi:hypothetical protein
VVIFNKKRTVKNYRVYYQINEIPYHIDFSVGPVITQETINISAWTMIKKSHPDVRREDVSNISVDELNGW